MTLSIRRAPGARAAMRSAAILFGLLLTSCPEPPTPPIPPTPPPAPPVPTAPDPSAIRSELEAQLARVNAALQRMDEAAFAAVLTDGAVPRPTAEAT